MLGAKYRFHSRGGVQATLKRGKTERGEKLSVVWAKNSRKGTRFGVVVGKKVLKSAVGRNRIRRRVYEIVRGWLKEQEVKNGVLPQIDALVVVYAADFREMEHGAFREQLWALLDKIKLS